MGFYSSSTPRALTAENGEALQKLGTAQQSAKKIYTDAKLAWEEWKRTLEDVLEGNLPKRVISFRREGEPTSLQDMREKVDSASKTVTDFKKAPDLVAELDRMLIAISSAVNGREPRLQREQARAARGARFAASMSRRIHSGIGTPPENRNDVFGPFPVMILILANPNDRAPPPTP